jgi:hypothetical protein
VRFQATVSPEIDADAFCEKGTNLGSLLQIVPAMTHPKRPLSLLTSQHVGTHLDSDERPRAQLKDEDNKETDSGYESTTRKKSHRSRKAQEAYEP